MKVTATLNNLRTSPRKVRLVANLIKGMDANVALTQLSHTVKKTSDDVSKLLSSAIANAENNFGLDRDNLFVTDIQVGEGPRLKRWLPRAHGRATLILKRTSKIFLTLEEKVEGKNRKSKEQLEKERKAREEARKKMEEEMIKEQEAELEKADAKNVEAKAEKTVAPKREGSKGAKKGAESTWMNKVFQRKSS